jgi:HPr kinase/phosphorylase
LKYAILFGNTEGLTLEGCDFLKVSGSVAYMSAVKLKDIFEDAEDILGITEITGETGLTREICQIRVQQYIEGKNDRDRLIPDTILILSPSYLSKLACTSSKARKNFFQRIISSDISCIAISGTDSMPVFMRSFSEFYHIVIFTSIYDEFLLESRLIGLLREKILHAISLHGSLVNVFGHGIMITGESGAGKTECACRLTEKGHAWIADDVVEVEKRSNMLYGRSQSLIKHLIHKRYRGIIDVKKLFNSAVICDETIIDIMIEFQITKDIGKEKECSYPVEKVHCIMGVTLPCFQLPAFPRGTNAHRCIENIVSKFML